MSNPEKVLEFVKDGPLDIYKYRWLFIGISLLFLIPGLYFLITNCLNPDIQALSVWGLIFAVGRYWNTDSPGRLGNRIFIPSGPFLIGMAILAR